MPACGTHANFSTNCMPAAGVEAGDEPRRRSARSTAVTRERDPPRPARAGSWAAARMTTAPSSGRKTMRVSTRQAPFTTT